VVPEADRRASFVDAATGKPAILVLRRGVVRVFSRQTSKKRHKGLPDEAIQLLYKTEVVCDGDFRLRIQTKVPYESERVFRAASDAEALAWRQALEASRTAELDRVRKFLGVLGEGSTAYKYNYSNSKRMRRHFWVDESKVELRWGKTRTDEAPQSMDLRHCVGIIYGPMTSTFQRCSSLEDPAWCCFSLLFEDRTLDMAVAGDLIQQWFAGLQHFLLEHSPSCTTALSEAQFTFRRVFYKLRVAAHQHGLTARTFLVQQVRSLGRDVPGLVARAASGDGGPDAKAESKRRKKRCEAVDGTSPGGTKRRSNGVAFAPPARGEGAAPDPEEEELRAMAADLAQQLSTQTARLERLGQRWQAAGAPPLEEVLDAIAGLDTAGWESDKCVELERDLADLRLANARSQHHLQAAERTEKQLKKLAKHYRDSEAQVQAMERELGMAKDGALSADNAKFSSGAARERAEAQTAHLQRRVAELEQQLGKVDSGGAELALLQEQNEKQADKLQSLSTEKATLSQQVEAITKEIEALESRRSDNEQKLKACQGVSDNLVGMLRRLQGAVADLRSEQVEAKRKTQDDFRSIADDFLPLTNAVHQVSVSRASLEQRYKEVAEERKRLHNIVLELKGNIRVFVRVRPMSDKEKAAETSGESTITFAEECKVSVYEANSDRRKWFEFDMAFQPRSAQQEVFEEVKPLATSVLDGYNVCIFAYGQTGSGKTFTMTGTRDNPGLNVRVLTELFRIRNDRKVDTDISISLMITEIYNETIKDLFTTKQKKLDVKQNPDGSNSVPGLTEIAVDSVEAVLKAMAEASGNRTVMATDMNEESSRSHSIVQVKTVCRTRKDSREYIGKINLIDLAGSENVNKSGVSGQGMKEAQNINKSLSALGDVIQALVAKTPHVPYRNSKLTMMLKDSLGGDSKTLMIVQSSPAQTNVVETLSSLNFASRARNVELGRAKRNVKAAD